MYKLSITTEFMVFLNLKREKGLAAGRRQV
jgi:hypothetical protein